MANLITPRLKRTIIPAICIALASQVNFTFYTRGFILTLSVILLPIFLYFNRDLHPIWLTLSIALASPFFRGLILLLTHNQNSVHIVQFVITDIAFYLCYGLIYYLLYWRRKTPTNSYFFFCIMLCDYLANVLEISLLLGFHNYTVYLFKALIITALIRSLLSCLLAFSYAYLHSLLRKMSHEQRYRHFLWITSSIKSDAYFMQKNVTEIERIMKNAYVLNEKLAQKPDSQAEQESALMIAHDVHEIKKDYQNVIIGLSDYFGQDAYPNMSLDDIIRVIIDNAKETIKERHLNVLIIPPKIKQHYIVPNHYYLVSVLSNLVRNSIDAISASSGNGNIWLLISEHQQTLWIQVQDNGPGIKPAYQKLIFMPGFTTKFDDQTGDSYRGIGLSNARTIIQEQFAGDITVTSKVNLGTTFTLKIDKDHLLRKDSAQS